MAFLLLFWSKFQYSVEKSLRISKFHGFIHSTYFLFFDIYLCKFILCYNFLCGLGVWIPDCHLGDPGSIPPQAKTFFYFFLLFPGLSQIFTKKQSWNLRCADFFRMNIKILTTRVLKKWSELTKVTWKIVQLNLKSNSILLISQLLNYRFSKVRPFLESME